MNVAVAEREMRIEDDHVQTLVENVAAANRAAVAWEGCDGLAELAAKAEAAEDALQEYIAKLRCDLIDERKRMLFLGSQYEAERGSVLVVICVFTLIGAAVGAAVASAMYALWLCG